MDDEAFERELVRVFDILGQAIYLTVKAAMKPSDAGVTALRAQWRNVGKQIVKMVKEERDGTESRGQVSRVQRGPTRAD